MGVGWQGCVNAAAVSRLSRDVMGTDKIMRSDYWGRSLMNLGIPDADEKAPEIYFETPAADVGFKEPVDREKPTKKDVVNAVNLILGTKFDHCLIADVGPDTDQHKVICYGGGSGEDGTTIGTRYQLLTAKQWKKTQKLIGDEQRLIPSAQLRGLVDNIFTLCESTVDEGQRMQRVLVEAIGPYLISNSAECAEDTDWVALADLISRGHSFIRGGKLYYFTRGLHQLLDERGLTPVNNLHWKAVSKAFNSKASKVPLYLEVGSGGSRQTTTSGYVTTVRDIESAIGGNHGTESKVRGKASVSASKGVYPLAN
jgi:hypothetical protein